jgi:hypothetical protein
MDGKKTMVITVTTEIMMGKKITENPVQNGPDYVIGAVKKGTTLEIV